MLKISINRHRKNLIIGDPMTAISMHSGVFTNGHAIAEKVSKETGLKLILDKDIYEKTASRYSMTMETLERAVSGKAFVFNAFTHEKERAIAHLKTIMAEKLKDEPNSIFFGYLGMLIPENIRHVLRILSISDTRHRLEIGKSRGLTEKETLKKIHSSDEKVFNWTQYLFHKEPWSPALYDIVIPSDKMDVDEAARLIIDNIGNPAVKETQDSLQKVNDFILAAYVEKELTGKGHCVTVDADKDNVTIVIDKKVILLSHLEEELKSIAKTVPGVQSVTTKIGKNYYKADIYRKFDFELSYKVLLVDDERDFAQTLSERLHMRDVGAHVVYNGQEALEFADSEDFEVMVLDLKMPGIDGFETLRQVKQNHPDIEVIILTGHGNEDDKKRCLEMGAFAYLQKPADIDILTQTMKDAYAKVRLNKEK